MPPDCKRGLTLLEIVVAVLIIAVLAALLFPVFAKARDDGHRLTCVSSIKQLDLGLLLYIQDFDQTYPNSRFWPLGSQQAGNLEQNSWRSVLLPYVTSSATFRCPQNPDSQRQSSDPRFKISYAANMAFNPRDYPRLPTALTATGSGLFGKDLSPGVKISQVVHPAECIAIVEITKSPLCSFVVDIANDRQDGYSAYSDCLFTGHVGCSNYAFADGHVKAIRPTQTYSGDQVNFWYRDGSPLGKEARTTLQLAESRGG